MPIKHIVAQGEYLALIARKLKRIGWDMILNEPANQELWKKGRTPNILYPGDEIVIPDAREKKVTRPTTATHTFKLKQPRNRLKIVLEKHDKKPFKGEKVKVLIQRSLTASSDDGLEIPAETDGAGLIDIPLPAGAVKATLTLVDAPWLRWVVLIGHLDPVHDPVGKRDFVSGVQARLNNLGFSCGAVDGVLGPRTRSAIARFQKEILGRKDAKGDLDDETRKAIVKEHRS